MDLLLFFDESVVLRDTAESKLVHEIDLVRIMHVLVLEVFDNEWECSREQHNLAVLRVEAQKLLNDGRELG